MPRKKSRKSNVSQESSSVSHVDQVSAYSVHRAHAENGLETEKIEVKPLKQVTGMPPKIVKLMGIKTKRQKRKEKKVKAVQTRLAEKRLAHSPTSAVVAGGGRQEGAGPSLGLAPATRHEKKSAGAMPVTNGGAAREAAVSTAIGRKRKPAATPPSCPQPDEFDATYCLTGSPSSKKPRRSNQGRRVAELRGGRHDSPTVRGRTIPVLSDLVDSEEGEDESSEEAEEEEWEDDELPNPQELCTNILRQLLSPLTLEQFMGKYWEEKCCLIRRSKRDFYDDIFSCGEFDNILRQERVMFGENLDVTSYEDGERQTHNPEGRAHAAAVWDLFQSGCSLRMLNPQSFSPNLHYTLFNLQEHFGSFVGANMYLTPPGTQGFAPHYDDIEAFVLQIEGRKRWRVYKPRNENEKLVRFSSKNFSQGDIGKPVLDDILESGEMLYFPRGFIHQAEALEDAHSLHITLSVHQRHCWGDLLEMLVPRLLRERIDSNVEFRRGLPFNLGQCFGEATATAAAAATAANTATTVKSVPNSSATTATSASGGSGGVTCTAAGSALARVRGLLRSLANDASDGELTAALHSATDRLYRGGVHSSLPPSLSVTEMGHGCDGQGEMWDSVQSCVTSAAELEPDTAVRLVRGSAVRLVRVRPGGAGGGSRQNLPATAAVATGDGEENRGEEASDGAEEGEGLSTEDEWRLYHCASNTTVYRQVPETYLPVEPEAVAAVAHLITAYPEPVQIEALPGRRLSLDDRIALVTTLYHAGLLLTEERLTEDLEDEELDVEDEGAESDESGADEETMSEDDEGADDEDTAAAEGNDTNCTTPGGRRSSDGKDTFDMSGSDSSDDDESDDNDDAPDLVAHSSSE